MGRGASDPFSALLGTKRGSGREGDPEPLLHVRHSSEGVHGELLLSPSVLTLSSWRGRAGRPGSFRHSLSVIRQGSRLRFGCERAMAFSGETVRLDEGLSFHVTLLQPSAAMTARCWHLRLCQGHLARRGGSAPRQGGHACSHRWHLGCAPRRRARQEWD